MKTLVQIHRHSCACCGSASGIESKSEWHAELKPAHLWYYLLFKVLILCPAFAQVSPGFWSMVLSQTQLDWACGSLSFHLPWTAKLAKICGEAGRGENRWPLTHLFTNVCAWARVDTKEWKYASINTMEYMCVRKMSLYSWEGYMSSDTAKCSWRACVDSQSIYCSYTVLCLWTDTFLYNADKKKGFPGYFSWAIWKM